ncbi:MAG: hypothetical protein Q9209_000822 [Squamulea sp. 1 TL-2023]
MPTTHHCMCCTKKDSIADISKDAVYIPRSSTTKPGPLDNLKDVECAIMGSNVDEGLVEGDNMRLLTSGGYNDVWLVNRPLDDADRSFEGVKCYVLRKPKEDALLPDKARNEVACLNYVRGNLPKVPVPQVYAYQLSPKSDVFIREEFIEGDRLSDVWSALNEARKHNLARQIAEIIVKLGESSFNGIGGLMLDGKLGPIVEGMKLFKSRDKFHSSTFYDFGPYMSTKQYVLACYDKEIYYYTHASHCDIDWDHFQTTSHDDFVQQLQAERESISEDNSAYAPQEPFVLVHGNLHGRNIMVKDGRVKVILDWEFAGTFPLSELLDGMRVDVLEAVDNDSSEKNNVWSERIVELAGKVARERGWDERKVDLLVENGDSNLQKVRVEMNP